jgi:hypothetical protein
MIKGNEWMSETVTSIAYKEEITATVRTIFLFFNKIFSITSLVNRKYLISLFSQRHIAIQRNGVLTVASNMSLNRHYFIYTNGWIMSI